MRASDNQRPDIADQVLAMLGDQLPIWRWDLADDRITWSDRVLEILGVTRSDLTGTFEDLASRLHPGDIDEVRATIESHISTGWPERLRCRLRHKDGHFLTILATGSAIAGPGGRPVAFFGTMIDLSREIEATARMVESEHRLKGLSENIPGAIYLYSIAPDGTHSIDFMNQGCLDIWELSAEDLAANPGAIRSLVLPEDVAGLQAAIDRSRETGNRLRHRWRIRTPSGLIKSLDGSALPEYLPDGTVQWNCLVLDITQHEETREELARQQIMLARAQKMEAVGRIAGGIAHDFNNLLAVIMGNAELLSDDRPVEPIQSEILEATERGADLTQRLLSFARKAPLAPAATDVNAAIAEMEPMISRVLPENIRFETALSDGRFSCEIDAAFFESAILNLVINSRDAMPKGGRLTLSTDCVDLDRAAALAFSTDLAPGRFLQITLRDSGEGIPPDLLDKVTEPFVTTKRKEHASGLGLAMVHGFANQSRGALRIESRVGEGTSVTICLPATEMSEPAQPAPAKAVSASEAPDAGHILVVEDEPAVLGVVSSLLSQQGFTVRIASSGDAADEYFRNGHETFDLLLTDVMMPGKIDGPALASRCISQNPDLKVIFMSGYANDREISSLGPCDGFLMKPVRRVELLSAVRNAISKEAS